ncbi:hypothetical protein C6501_19780 [Candidatus Poribacteria bacterium]|nr:MAG: hypothetical protein C6501_19780 [Candidatus Poribacteria bacterium]
MKQTRFLISMLLLVPVLFLANGFAQDYVHYKTLAGHSTSVWSVAFSPDGQTLASGSSDGTIHLWDVRTGTHKKTLTGHSDWVRSVAFSSDGQTLASGSYDHTIRLWDVVTGRHLKTLAKHTQSVTSVSFSPDGQTLANGSWDCNIRLWDAVTGRHKKTLTGHTDFVSTISFSPDGQTLASGGFVGGTIRLWDVSTGTNKRTLTGHTSSVSSVAFSPDGQTLASGSYDNTIRLWDMSTGTNKRTLTGHTDGVSSVAFSPDGQILASGSRDSTIHLWDVRTGTHKRTLTGHSYQVVSVAFSSDGKTLASGSSDKTIRLWKLTSPRTTKPDSPTPPKPTANQVYTNAIRAVMWIVNPGIGEGSGVLLDKKHKLAVTNAHVTGPQNTIDVYFPAPDEKGELIKDRNFYLTNGGVLKRLGYYTKAHVIARNEKTDLAIIRLDGFPETAREIDWNFTPPTTKVGELVYILGNPAKQELWRWTLGEFLNDHEDFLHIQSDVFGGNSGGPVLNKQGILIGIVARSDQLMNAAAIPIRHINRLLSESNVKHSRFRR